METIKLAAKKRDASTKAKKLRLASLVPGVVYGKGVPNREMTIDYNTFAKAYRAAGESTLIDLAIDDEPSVKVLVKDTQIAPLTDRFTHVDFYQVDMRTKLRTEIALEFIGEAPAVKELGGSLIKAMDHFKVECLPGDLVHSIEVDVTGLKAFGDMIHVKDIKVPTGITVLDNPDDTIAFAEAPMSEDQLKAMENAPAVADVTAVKTEAEVKKAEEEAKKAAEAAATKE